MAKYRIVVIPVFENSDRFIVQKQKLFFWFTIKRGRHLQWEFINVNTAKNFIDNQMELDQFNKEQKKRIIYYP